MHVQPALAGESRSTFSLSDIQKRFLLTLAREAIIEAVSRLPVVHAPGEQEAEVEQDLAAINAGVFVSLHLDDSLRGCIGYLEAIQPLLAAVPDTARAAALRDPRFEPVREDELADLEIEISVLSPLEVINGPDEIAIGRDGLMVRSGKKQGVLLPQVAQRANFDPLSFLEHTCLKAGLPKDTWKLPQTEVFCFKAEVFSEKSKI